MTDCQAAANLSLSTVQRPSRRQPEGPMTHDCLTDRFTEPCPAHAGPGGHSPQGARRAEAAAAATVTAT